MNERLSTSKYLFIWFGAAVSLAEILAGTFFAPLGFERGIIAILVGHVIGAVLFWLAAYVSAKTGKPAMEAVKIAFGQKGSWAFSLANVAQLIGWTSIMIMSGAAAAFYLVPAVGHVGWCFIIGALIVVWVAIGFKKMSLLQSIASVLLFILTCVISVVVFGSGATVDDPATLEAISFGAAVELAVAMPLSWLPVVGDYTSRAKRPIAATTMTTISYFVGSCWMFAIGLGTALFLGSSDIAQVMALAGLGIVGILVVIFSTVTTTFLDAASAGISFTSIFKKLRAKYVGIGVALVGCALAAWAPVANFEPFLYLIGSVFAPMIAILFVEFYLMRSDASKQVVNWTNVVLWLLGFVLYRISMSWDFVLGNTIIVMIAVGAVSFVVHKIQVHFASAKESGTPENLTAFSEDKTTPLEKELDHE